MPNYVTTILRIEGTDAQIEAVKNHIKGEDTAFDFNKVIPMPAALNIECSTRGQQGVDILFCRENKITKAMTAECRKEAVALGLAYIENTEMYGFPTWYEWCRAKWGTKWNACEVEDLGDAIKFETAWNFPRPVIIELSKMFPDVILSFDYADEAAGHNTGEGTIQAGEFISEYYPQDGGTEAMRVYLITHEGAEEDWELLHDGTYKYKGD